MWMVGLTPEINLRFDAVSMINIILAFGKHARFVSKEKSKTLLTCFQKSSITQGKDSPFPGQGRNFGVSSFSDGVKEFF